MLKYILYKTLPLLVVGLTLMSCKTQQPPATNSADQYFTVSLYSPGDGIDQEARKIILSTIDAYTKKGHEITHTAVPWGKEGEVDYCFSLQKLKPSVYQEFFQELSTLLKDRQVHIKEKVPCRSNY